MIHKVLFSGGNHSVSCGIHGRNGGFPPYHFSGGFLHCLEWFSCLFFFLFVSFSGECHGSMIHEVLLSGRNHSVSCGIPGRNGGFPLHHFSGGFLNCLEWFSRLFFFISQNGWLETVLLVIKHYINTINIKRVHFIATLITSTKGSLQSCHNSIPHNQITLALHMHYPQCSLKVWGINLLLVNTVFLIWYLYFHC